MQDKIKLLEEKQKMMEAIDLVLESLLAQTKHLKQEKTPFHYLSEPSISVSSYLRRIAIFSHCSQSVYVCALILIDRIQEQNEQFFVTPRCIHRILISAIVIAAKTIDDFYYKNSYYAKIAGLPLKEFNNLELKFLQLLNFNVNISPQTFHAYITRLEQFESINQRTNKSESIV